MNNIAYANFSSVTASEACTRIERAIERRREQNRTLMWLMIALRNLKERRCASNPAFACDIEAAERHGTGVASLTVVLHTGERCKLDVRFISKELQPAFARVMRHLTMPEESAAGNEEAVRNDEIEAIRISIRNRINQFDSLNREDFEHLRLLAQHIAVRCDESMR